MLNYLIKVAGKDSESNCCGVEINEVEVTEQADESCCSSSGDKNNSCC